MGQAFVMNLMTGFIKELQSMDFMTSFFSFWEKFKGSPVVRFYGVLRARHGFIWLIGCLEGGVSQLLSFGIDTNSEIHFTQNWKKSAS